MKNQSYKYSGIVWLAAGVSLCVYGGMGLFGYKVPGVEELVTWLYEVEGHWIILAAFISILIEGLYFVGSFFPGATLVVLISVLSQLQSWTMFALTISAIFIGWVLAGVINILFTSAYCKLVKKSVDQNFEISDRTWVTWFPSFRANFEVAQIVSGGEPLKVFWSSVRVKIWGSLVAAMHVATLPFFIDVTAMSNEEGFLSVFIVALIMLTVGVVQIRKAKTTD